MSKKFTHLLVNMIESLITSQTRIKLLLKFFINPKMSGYLRELAREFGESTNAVRLELNKLEQAKILNAASEGRQKIYRANVGHPLFEEIRSIVLKSSGVDQVITTVLHNLGDLRMAFITGDYAVGRDSGLIDLVLVGDFINQKELERVRIKAEGLIARKIRTLVLNEAEYENLKTRFASEKMLVVWE